MYQIAQINIAKLKKPLDHPDIHGFTSRLDEINQLAESYDGFVWRYRDEEVDNSSSVNFMNQDNNVVNISVWESIEKLKEFTYKSVHVELFKNRKEWMEEIREMSFAIWWIKPGKYPTLNQCAKKLILIRKHGPTKDAFHFGKVFEAGIE